MKKLKNKKASSIELAIKLIDTSNYINLLIIKPFKAGVIEQNIFFVSIDSWPIGRCDNGSPP